jgi:hypothetical protein
VWAGSLVADCFFALSPKKVLMTSPSSPSTRADLDFSFQHQMCNDYDAATEQNLYWCLCAPTLLTSKRQVLHHLRLRTDRPKERGQGAVHR